MHRVNDLNILGWICACGLFAAVIFTGFPQLDLISSDLFYLDNGQFAFNAWAIGPFFRVLFRYGFILLCLLALTGLIVTIFGHERFLNFTFPKWLFLVAGLIIGPGLVANTLFKDNWGRARPVQIEQFGGTKTFTPVMVRTDQCQKNCSYISGEASSIFAALFGFALLARRRRKALGFAILMGLAAGAVRIAQGGHFLSDVVFAGIWMALIMAALHWAIFVRWRESWEEGGTYHQLLFERANKMKQRSARLRKKALLAWQNQRRQKQGKNGPEDEF